MAAAEAAEKGMTAEAQATKTTERAAATATAMKAAEEGAIFLPGLSPLDQPRREFALAPRGAFD